MRVTLKDGSHHEELGYGVADGMPSKGFAIERARKVNANAHLMCRFYYLKMSLTVEFYCY